MKLSIEHLAEATLAIDPLPEVSRSILQAVLKDRPVDRDELLALVRLDSALCLKLLYLGNSASFGNPGRIGNLEQAVQVLDWEIILDSLLSQVSRVSLASQPSVLILNDQRLFWKHSLACARFSRLLARQAGFPDPEMAYLAGLIHDFAKITLYHRYPREYRAIFSQMENDRVAMFEAEMRIFSSHHASAAGEMLRGWNCPNVLCEAVASHHALATEFDRGKPEVLLSWIVRAADVLAYRIREGDGGNSQHALSPDLLKELRPLVTLLDAGQLQAQKDALHGEAERIGLGRIDPEQYINLLAECNRLLGRRAMELRNSLREISLMHQIRQIFLIAQSLQEVFSAAARELISVLHARIVAFMIDEGEEGYRLYAASPLAMSDPVLYNVKKDLCKHWNVQVRTLIDPAGVEVEKIELPRTSLEGPSSGESSIRSHSCFMLHGQAGPLGLLGVFSDRSHVFTPAERERFLIVAELIAMGLERFRMEEQTRQMSVTDGLTGLLNHRQFEILLNNELKGSQRHSFPVGLIIMDLDHFKRVNDTYGHLTGDQVLRETADLLRGQTRESDVVARYGGEEFAMILSHTNLSQSAAMAERVRQAIEAHLYCAQEGRNLKVTVSLGVACFPAKGIQGAEDLIAAADTALYDAKRSGRNRVATAQQPE